jgi:hypothetical protein
LLGGAAPKISEVSHYDIDATGRYLWVFGHGCARVQASTIK